MATYRNQFGYAQVPQGASVQMGHTPLNPGQSGQMFNYGPSMQNQQMGGPPLQQQAQQPSNYMNLGGNPYLGRPMEELNQLRQSTRGRTLKDVEAAIMGQRNQGFQPQQAPQQEMSGMQQLPQTGPGQYGVDLGGQGSIQMNQPGSYYANVRPMQGTPLSGMLSNLGAPTNKQMSMQEMLEGLSGLQGSNPELLNYIMSVLYGMQ